MTRRSQRAVGTLVAGLAVLAIGVGPQAQSQTDATGRAIGVSIASGASVAGVQPETVLTAQSVLDTLVESLREPWAPRASRERLRGMEALYEKAAPAVVVVKTATGHGTGFHVGGGFIVTNEHVVHSGLELDVVRQASAASVHLGQLAVDGAMVVESQARRAYLVKVNAEKDLALLKLEGAALPTLPSLGLASAGPRPGLDCTIIGHPSSGMLWTVRSGHVSSVGRSPQDMIDVALARLRLDDGARARLQGQLADAGGFRIFLSSAGANPGDSGGPVLNAQGQVIGVTFAIPSDVGERRFTYHIHLDELREFVATRPATPTLSVPDPWDLGARIAFLDLDGDKRPDAIAEQSQREGLKLLIDVDGDSALPDASVETLRRVVQSRSWDWELGLHLEPGGSVAFYDADNDGTAETVVTGDLAPNIARYEYRQAKGVWRVQPGTGEVITPRRLGDPRLAGRAAAMLGSLSKLLQN